MDRRIIHALILLALLAGSTGTTAAAGAPDATPPPTAFYLMGHTGGTPAAIASSNGYVYLAAGSRILVYTGDPNYQRLVGQAGLLAQAITDVAIGTTGGRSYLYAGTRGAGAAIYALAEPAHPQLVATLNPTGNSYVNELEVAGDRLYSLSGQRLYAYDIRDPRSPLALGDGVLFTDYSSYVQQMTVNSGRAYFALGSAGIAVADLADPAHLAMTGLLDTPGYATDIAAAGNTVVVADNGGGALVVDASRPASLRLISTYRSPYSYPSLVTMAGNVAYVYDAGHTSIAVLDVSQPAVPQAVGGVELRQGIHGLALNAGQLYGLHAGGFLLIDLSDAVPVVTADAFAGGSYRAVAVSQEANAQGLAFLVGPSGFFVASLLDPTQPRVVARLEGMSNLNDVAIRGRYAYAIDNNRSIFVIDLATPTAPQLAASLLLEKYAESLAVTSGGAYLVGSSYLSVVDISNPLSPSFVGGLDMQSASDIAVAGNFAYIAAGLSGLRIVDVTDPRNPRPVASAPTGTGYAQGIALDGGYAYVATYDKSYVVSVADPNAPQVISSGLTYGGNAAVGDGRLYIGGWSELFAYDLTDRANPVRMATISTSLLGDADLAVVPGGVLTAGAQGIALLRLQGAVAGPVGYNGGVLNVPADGVTYTFPHEALHDGARVEHFHEPAELATTLPGLIRVTPVYNLRATYPAYGGDQPNPIYRPFTVEVVLNEGITPAQLTSLALYTWQEDRWQRVASSNVNATARKLTATLTGAGRWAVFSRGLSSSLPLITWGAGVLAPADLTIGGLEITQAIQDPGNSVPLVANRPTVLRVYGRTAGTIPFSGITLSVSATRDGQPLPGSPIRRGPWSLFPAPDRGLFATSYTVRLPAAWLSGNVTLTTTLDPDNTVPEPDEWNNTAQFTASFTPVPPLVIKFVPVNYTETSTGRYFPATVDGNLAEFTRHSYPISDVQTSVHPPIDFAGDLAQPGGWNQLLDVITAVRSSEGAPAGLVYYGVVPVTNAAGERPSFAYGGMGWIGRRASIGGDTWGGTLAHEMGHNFGLPHAPCGVSGEAAYPYPNASIGQYGLNPYTMRLWTPAAPDNTKDVMSYCGPQWFSDYNYRKLYENQRNKGAFVAPATQPQPALLIRADLSEDGAARFLPTYALDMPLEAPANGAPVTAEASGYRVELVDAGGRILAAQAADVYEAQEDGPRHRAVHMTLQRPAAEVSALRLLRDGAIIATQAFTHPHVAPLAPALTGDGKLAWPGTKRPALVRYTTDGGATWTTLALDVVGGALAVPADAATGAATYEVILAQ